MNKHRLLAKIEEEVVKQRKFSKKDFERIYMVFYKKVFDFINKRVSSSEIAEDLASDVFEKIYKSIDDFKWQGVTISAWIFRIARNRVIDHYRKSSKYKNNVSLFDISNIVKSDDKKAEDFMLERDEFIVLYNSIREFREEDQYLIYYKFFEELSNKEIAKLLRLTETNVGTKLHRIRKKLAKVIRRLERKPSFV